MQRPNSKMMLTATAWTAALALALGALMSSSEANAAAVSFSTIGGSYSEDFDSLPNTPNGGTSGWTNGTTLQGWHALASGVAPGTIRITEGQALQGQLLSEGSIGWSERALGGQSNNSGAAELKGVQIANDTGSSSATDSINIRVGANSNTATPANFFLGDLAELIVYDRVLNSTELGQINAYLDSKWNTLIPEPSTALLLGFGLVGLVARRRRGVASRTALVAALFATVTLSANLGNAAFVPSDFSGNVLWLDGHDVDGNGTSGGTFSGGNTWVDKSGQANNAVTSAGAPAVVSGALNGRGVVRVDGDDTMTVSQNLFNVNNHDITVFAVGTTSVASQAGTQLASRMWYANRNGVPTSTLLSLGQETTDLGVAWNDGGFTTDLGLTAMTADAGFISILSQDLSLTQQTVDFNGTNVRTDGAFTFATGEVGATTDFLLGSASGGRFWSGDLAEFIVYDRVLSESEVNQVGYFLQQKWGIASGFTAIPEPSTALLLVMGLVGLAARRRRSVAKLMAAPLAVLLTICSAQLATAAIMNPTQISGNVLWLDGADVDGDGTAGGDFSAALWVDKSGNGNDISQASPTLRPINSNTINGNQVVTFDGGNDFLTNAAASYTARSVFVVFQPNSGTQNTGDLAQFWGSYEDGVHIAGDARGGNPRSFSFNGDNSPATTAFWALGGDDLSGTAVDDTGSNIWSYDTPQLVSAEFAAGVSLNEHFISNLDTAAGHFYGGDIAEIIVFDRVLTDGSITGNDNELNDVRFYLQQKWNLGLGLNPTVPEPSTFVLLALGLVGLAARRRKVAVALLIAVALISSGSQAQAVIVPETVGGTYDAAGGSTVDTNSSGNPLGSTLTTDVAGFTTLVANRFAADFGGVIDFDGPAENAFTGIDASYGGGTKTLRLLSDNTLDMRSFTSIAEISGTQGLFDANLGSPDFSLTVDSITGGELLEAVTQFGVTVLSRDSTPVTATVTANFSDGSSSFISDAIASGQGNDNTFFSLVAPQGQSITGLDFTFAGGGADIRMAIDDLAFITAVVVPIPEPSTLLLLVFGLVGFAVGRRKGARFTVAACTVLLLSNIGSSANAALIQPSLHYSFDTADVSGSTVTDLGTSGTNGTINGSVPLVAGQFGQAASIVAGGTNFVSANTAFLSTGSASQSYTIAFWMQNDGTAPNSGSIVSQYTAGDAERFMITNDEQFSASGEVSWWHGDDGVRNETGSNVSDGAWHHIALVKDGTSSLSIYVDGVLDQTNGSATDVSEFAGTNLEIGRGAATTHPYTGLVDELQIFDVALTGSEVGFLYNYNATVFVAPEPSTFFMLGAGLVGLVARRRRGRSLRQLHLLAMIVACIGFANSAQATIVSDDFDYADALLRDVPFGGTGFGGDWGDPGGNTNTLSVVNGSNLSYTGGGYNVPQAGNALVTGSNGSGFRGSNRDLGTALTGEVWFSALVRNGASTASSGIQFNNLSSSFNYAREDWDIQLDGSTLDVNYNGTINNDVATGLTVGDTHLILGRWTVGAGNDTLDVWVNPGTIGMLDAPDFTDGSADIGASLTTVGLFTFGAGGGQFDALRLSDGLSALIDVSGAYPIPEPSTVLLLMAGLVGLVARRRRTSRVLAITGLSLVTCFAADVQHASAALIARETFESYSAGSALSGSGGFGWTGAWATGGAGAVTVENASLSYTGGLFDIQGGNRAAQLVYPNASIDVAATRPFASQTGTVYMSFLVQQSIQNGGDSFQQVGLDDTALDNPNVSVADNGGVFNARGNTGGDASTGVTSTTGETFFAVMRITKGGGNYNDVEVVINPTSIFESGNTFTSDGGDTGISSVSNFNIRRAFQTNGDTYLIDSVRIGTTWNDVITVAVPEPSTALLLSVGLVGLVARRRRNAAKNVAVAASLIAMVALFGSEAAQAATINPIADSYAHGTATGTNFGTSTTLQIKNDNGTANNARKAYFKFDLSTLGFAPAATFSSSLNLEFIDTTLGSGGTTTNWEFEVYGLNDGDAGETWGEGTIDWTNAPANDTSSANAMLGNATSLGTFSFLGRTASVDFSSPQLTSFLTTDTDGVATLMIVRNTPQPGGSDTYVHGIASRENGTFAIPSLTAANLVPEPSTALLLGVGLVGFVARRRRGVAKNTTIAASLVAVIAFAGGTTASAALISIDFNDAYSTGNLDSQNPVGDGLNAWSGDTDIDVVAGNLVPTSAPTGYLAQAGTGQRVQATNTTGTGQDVDVSLVSPLTGNDLWFSYLLNQGDGSSRGGIDLSGAGGNLRVIGVGSDVRMIGPGLDVGSGSGLLTVTTDTHFILGQVVVDDGGNETINLWVDPANLNAPGAVDLTASTNFIDGTGLTGLSIESYGSSASGRVDQIALAESQSELADALTVAVPEPSTALLLVFGMVGLVSRRRRGVAKIATIAASLIAVIAFAGSTTASAAQIASFSFTGATDGDDTGFANESNASGVTVSTLGNTTFPATGGVVSSFLDAGDESAPAYTFDGKGYRIAASQTNNGSTTNPDHYFEFSVAVQSGYNVRLSSLTVDFGTEIDGVAPAGTIAQYDLFADINGGGFSRTGISDTTSLSTLVSSANNHNITNDETKSLLGSAASPFTNGTIGEAEVFNGGDVITFRLAFADSNSGSGNKHIFIDDIQLFGTASIPEPSSLLLAGLGLLGLVSRRRRRS